MGGECGTYLQHAAVALERSTCVEAQGNKGSKHAVTATCMMFIDSGPGPQCAAYHRPCSNPPVPSAPLTSLSCPTSRRTVGVQRLRTVIERRDLLLHAVHHCNAFFSIPRPRGHHQPHHQVPGGGGQEDRHRARPHAGTCVHTCALRTTLFAACWYIGVRPCGVAWWLRVPDPTPARVPPLHAGQGQGHGTGQGGRGAAARRGMVSQGQGARGGGRAQGTLRTHTAERYGTQRFHCCVRYWRHPSSSLATGSWEGVASTRPRATTCHVSRCVRLVGRLRLAAPSGTGTPPAACCGPAHAALSRCPVNLVSGASRVLPSGGGGCSAAICKVPCCGEGKALAPSVRWSDTARHSTWRRAQAPRGSSARRGARAAWHVACGRVMQGP